MPLYVADYLADTGHLSTAEHGAYMLLIMHYWQSGGLPPDDARLARICRLTPKDWAASQDTLAEFFQPGWAHARIDHELASANAAYDRRAKAGRKGGKATAKSVKGRSNAGSNAESNAKAGLQQSQSPPSVPSEGEGFPPNLTDRTLGKGTLPPRWDDDAPFGDDRP